MKIDEIYNTIFEKAAIGIAVVDQHRNFIKVNPYFTKMLGYTSDELEQMNVAEVTHADDMEENIRLDDAVVSKELESFTMQKRYIRKDGSVFWVLLTITGHDTPDGIVFLAQAQDISEHKELENMKAKEALDSIVVTYHHEINNPLAIAMGAIQIMKLTNTLSEKHVNAQFKAFERIRTILKKIEQVADASKLTLERYDQQSKLISLEKNSIHESNTSQPAKVLKGDNLKALIVDDEELLLDSLEPTLEDAGYAVIRADNGEKAIEALKKNKVDLVISDVRMPKVTGVELLAEINSSWPSIPVVLMTGFTDLKEQEALELGAAAVLKKPFEYQALYTTLDTLKKKYAA